MATSTGAPDEFTRHTLIHLFGQARLDEANALAEQMIGSHPKHSLAWKVKGAIQLRLGDFLGAIKTIQKAIALAPKDWELFNSLGLAFKGMGKLSNAQAAYQQAISLNPQYPNVYVNLGALLRESGKLDQALKCYRKKLELTPDDEEAHFHAAALSGEQLPTAPGIYVKNLFDQYAQRFDQHLTGALKYETPKHLAELFFRHHTLPAHATVLDLGCGTGLVAQAFASNQTEPFHAHWIGVDLSPQMIEQARAKHRYQALLCSDLHRPCKPKPITALIWLWPPMFSSMLAIWRSRSKNLLGC